MPDAKIDSDFSTLETALELAGEHGWQETSLTDIANASGKPLSALYASGGKSALSKQMEAWGDLAMSAEPSEAEDSPRERLFDVIMRRFEKYETQRAGVLSLMTWRDGSPALRAEILRARARSANWALACAKLDTLGPIEMRMTGLGLGWVISQTTRAWRHYGHPGCRTDYGSGAT
jgi:AcrR family transcriptional regulator